MNGRTRPPASGRYRGGRDFACRYGSDRLLVELVGADRRVLDVGCAGGEIARRLAARGCTVVGLEVDAVAAAEAAGVCREVVVGSVEDDAAVARAADLGPFDVILAAEVLEHLVDPCAALRRLTPLLAASGSFVVSVPNIAYWGMRARLLMGRFDYTPTGLLDETHLRFFTLTTARALLEGAGLCARFVAGTPAVLGGHRLRRIPLLGHALLAASGPVAGGLAHLRPQVFGYQLVFRAWPANRPAAVADDA